jgi:hypothetical protein
MTKEDHDKTNKATKNKTKQKQNKTKTKQNQQNPTINTKQEW